ncbi:hypothetical protein D5018_03880 [Parashewanella curva]|uniref:Uncharacterized protein n=1 Tax=Parashewanella curva TaxID=2338552 RepID=A0A3L8Q047_9GAMM|nr:hypothetical protein [Parashewanella curva]RLV60991.1 hypothetical protein D5018_03880 [Parashewanella curva]
MLLQDLRLTRRSFGKDEGKMIGSAEFSNKQGKVTIKLTAEQCDKILRVCADSVIENSKEAAEMMTAGFIEAKAVLIEGDSNGN